MKRTKGLGANIETDKKETGNVGRTEREKKKGWNERKRPRNKDRERDKKERVGKSMCVDNQRKRLTTKD